MSRFFLLLSFTILLLNCNNPKIEKDPKPTIGYAPHEARVENEALDVVDAQILAEAKGLKMERSSSRRMLLKWNAPSDKSELFFFWSIEDKDALERLKTLHALENEEEAQAIKLMVVNLDGPKQVEKADAILRESGLVAKRYYLRNRLDFVEVDKDWTGETPKMYLVNKQEKMKSAYSQYLELEELKAVLQSFILSKIE